eukprot:762753-Hanusia_phi.AAC.2
MKVSWAILLATALIESYGYHNPAASCRCGLVHDAAARAAGSGRILMMRLRGGMEYEDDSQDGRNGIEDLDLNMDFKEVLKGQATPEMKEKLKAMIVQKCREWYLSDEVDDAKFVQSAIFYTMIDNPSADGSRLRWEDAQRFLEAVLHMSKEAFSRLKGVFERWANAEGPNFVNASDASMSTAIEHLYLEEYAHLHPPKVVLPSQTSSLQEALTQREGAQQRQRGGRARHPRASSVRRRRQPDLLKRLDRGPRASSSAPVDDRHVVPANPRATAIRRSGAQRDGRAGRR